MPPKTALVLEDNFIFRQFLIEILEEKHFKVAAFADPVQYFDCLNRNGSLNCSNFDIIITDNLMPNMTGLEFLEKIAMLDGDFPKQRQAIISGEWQAEDQERAQRLGCHIFHKPCTINQIHDWLDEVIGQDQ